MSGKHWVKLGLIGKQLPQSKWPSMHSCHIYVYGKQRHKAEQHCAGKVNSP